MIHWKRTAGRSTEFEEVALVHLDALYQTALRLTHNRAEAEDIVQDTYVRAFRSFDRFDPGTNCRAWLFTILRNVFLNRVRKNRYEVPEADAVPEVVASATSEAAAESPEDHFFQTVLHGDVDRALESLPLPFREAVILADLQGLTYKEVADVLGCPIGTVMSRLSRGRHLLKDALSGVAAERRLARNSE